MYKIIQMYVSVELIKVIDSYLAHKLFRIKMNGAVSEWKSMLVVMPPGSTLYPMLYNIYTSIIPKSIRTELSVYVDDIWIYDQNKSRRFAHLTVQRLLGEVERWATIWRIRISAEEKNKKAVVFYNFPNSKLKILQQSMFQESAILGLLLIMDSTGEKTAKY